MSEEQEVPKSVLPDFAVDYTTHEVTLKFLGKTYGGIPMAKDVIEAWAETKSLPEETKKAALDQGKDPDEIVERSWTTFLRDDKGLYLECRQIKAMVKESISILRLASDKRGLGQDKQHNFEIFDTDGFYGKIYLGKTEADGYDDGVVHAMTPQGPRSSLKRKDYVEKAEIKFLIKYNQRSGRMKMSPDIIEQALKHAESFIGIGADRSQGGGKFVVTGNNLIKAKPVKKSDDAEKVKIRKPKTESVL